jgi:acetylornithine deacetylase/succinyl-diaminopimelate desuccinylase-like protein
VIPGEAWAQLDIRMLPGEDPEALRAELLRVVNDPNVTIEPVNKEFRKANFSPTNTELYAAFRKASAAYFGNAPVAPYLTGGYTENQRYREIGIESYGFSPYAVLEEVSHTEHGDDERIAVDEVRRGFRVLYDVVNEVAGAK